MQSTKSSFTLLRLIKDRESDISIIPGNCVMRALSLLEAKANLNTKTPTVREYLTGVVV